MLSDSKYHDILSRLAQGDSIRLISQETGVSRATISRIAHGKHPLQCRPPEKIAGSTALSDPVRCPTCGAMILIDPCQACLARRSQSPPPQDNQSTTDLDVDLHGREKSRYLKVREKVQKLIDQGKRTPFSALGNS